MGQTPVPPERERTLAEEFADLTWQEIEADGVITLEEIEADLRAKGYDTDDLDALDDLAD